MCGRVLHKKTFRLKNAKAVILKKNSKIKNLHQIALEGKKLNVFLGKGSKEFAQSLSQKIGEDLDCILRGTSRKK